MEKGQLRLASRGDAGLLVFGIPAELANGGEAVETFALPLLSRSGGLLLALPQKALDENVLISGMQPEEGSMVGPNKLLESPLFEEEEGGGEKVVKNSCKFFLVDFSDEVLQFLREYDPALDDVESFIPFDEEHRYALISTEGLVEKAREWAGGAGPRAAFYSAREDLSPAAKTVAVKRPKRPTNAAMMEMIEGLQAQVAALTAASVPTRAAPAVTHVPVPPGGLMLASPKMPSLGEALRNTGGEQPTPISQLAAMVGPPPKVRGPALRPPPEHVPNGLPEDEPRDPFETTDPVVRALAQQGSALTALVAHLTSDPISDLHQLSSSASSSTRGVQKRERMMAELSTGSSQFFMQFQQQLHRRLQPATPVPQTAEELAASPASMLTYLERFGGYKGQRTLGMTMWLLAHCMDAAARGDMRLCLEHLSLTVAALEQVGVDQGDWSLAFLQSLVSEPPLTVFQERQQQVQMYSKSFGALTPVSWSATSLAYLKELEVLSTKKVETAKKAKTEEAADTQTPSPKRKPRYPKKPKGEGAE